MNARLGFPSIAVWGAAQADLLEPRYVRPICSTPRRVDEDPVKRAELRAADNQEPERAAPLKQPEKPAAAPAPASAGFKTGDKVRYRADCVVRIPSLAGIYTVASIRPGGGVEFVQGGWEVPDWLELIPAPDTDGWVTWGGGECPVAPNSFVEYRMRCGACYSADASTLNWKNNGADWNILAYRECSH